MKRAKKKAPKREPKTTALTREQLIYMWKIDGGNMSWARWSALVDVPKNKIERISKAIV